jgi:hypothetical protein
MGVRPQGRANGKRVRVEVCEHDASRVGDLLCVAVLETDHGREHDGVTGYDAHGLKLAPLSHRRGDRLSGNPWDSSNMDEKTTRLFNVLSVCTLALGIIALVVAAIHVATDQTFPEYALTTAAIGFLISWGFRYFVRSAARKSSVDPS